MSAVDQIQLNLARKWRSKQFDQIIGQDLSIRILKNSLFRGKFFPVYLFAGQHGCGKTTTARVFAAAVNCAHLPDFQHNPKKFTVPCLTCDSCKAMLSGRHPDFIEIDAASHTGVDNVRQIVEASTLLPVMGRKKVYLIDEAHMLSKAAFNAFLKILEEPPEAVFFILATTDEHKIIDTVKSRCFQLFFNGVQTDTLVRHLSHVCKKEEIAFDEVGLQAIIKETGGSVRDALNLLEQVCFSAQCVKRDDVLRVLGYMPEEKVYALIEKLFLSSTAHELIGYLESLHIGQYSVEYVWKRVLDALHMAVWLKNGVYPDGSALVSASFVESLKHIPLDHVLMMFERMCEEEMMFMRTINKSLFLQLLFVRLWNKFHVDGIKVCSKEELPKKESLPVEQPKNVPHKIEKKEIAAPVPVSKDVRETSPWVQFVKSLDELDEPLFLSIMKQASFEKADDKEVCVTCPQRMRLFQETIDQLMIKWEPKLHKVFGAHAKLNVQFTASTEHEVKKKSPVVASKPAAMTRKMGVHQALSARGKRIDVSDKNYWPLSNTLLNYFPGIVVEIPEQKNESIHE